jgi:hypothetical protein
MRGHVQLPIMNAQPHINFLDRLGKKRNRESYTATFKRVPRQPFYAWCGLIASSFFVAINGWYHIFAATSGAGVNRMHAWEVAVGLIASYFGVCVRHPALSLTPYAT